MHHVPPSRLHAVPLALYKAVVDATNWRCFAAALAALEEYNGVNGACTSCQAAARTDGGEGIMRSRAGWQKKAAEKKAAAAASSIDAAGARSVCNN